MLPNLFSRWGLANRCLAISVRRIADRVKVSQALMSKIATQACRGGDFETHPARQVISRECRIGRDAASGALRSMKRLGYLKSPIQSHAPRATMSS